VGTNRQVTPTERLHAAMRDRRWSEKELAWVLDLPIERAEDLVREPRITPTLTLRLEAALELSAGDSYAAAGMRMPDLWALQDQMAGELDAIRRRRYRLSHDRRDGT
jgi:plasmid maintenance system antidote protein VapI